VVLLLHADRVVAVDDLVAEVWNDQPPATARTQVAICVGALRRALRDAGCAGAVIATTEPGYRLDTTGHRTDVSEFAELLREAGQAETDGQLDRSVRMLDRALRLWRGLALDGVRLPRTEGAVARLNGQRATAHERYLLLRLRLGRHRAVLDELAALVGEAPLREQPRLGLMLAQYRCGHRAEALRTYRDGRDRSIRELGLEPGRDLRALHEAILRDDPALLPAPELYAPDRGQNRTTAAAPWRSYRRTCPCSPCRVPVSRSRCSRTPNNRPVRDRPSLRPVTARRA
jgi:DNA-binding SARP family transcriptional activator